MKRVRTTAFDTELRTLLAKLRIRLPSKNTRDEIALRKIQTTFGAPIPQPLQAIELLLRGHRFANCHDHFLSMNKWYVRNNHLVFAEENQGIVLWAIRLKDSKQLDDPPVFQGDPDAKRWYLESNRLSCFLLRAACWQAVNGWFRYFHEVVESRRTIKRKFADLKSYCPPESRVERDMDCFVDEGFCVCIAYQSGEAVIKIGSSSKASIENFCRVYSLPEFDTEIGWH